MYRTATPITTSVSMPANTTGRVPAGTIHGHVTNRTVRGHAITITSVPRPGPKAGRGITSASPRRIQDHVRPLHREHRNEARRKQPAPAQKLKRADQTLSNLSRIFNSAAKSRG